MPTFPYIAVGYVMRTYKTTLIFELCAFGFPMFT